MTSYNRNKAFPKISLENYRSKMEGRGSGDGIGETRDGVGARRAREGCTVLVVDDDCIEDIRKMKIASCDLKMYAIKLWRL